ncbi:hypothetical protein ACO3TA_02905 [Methanocaldococcus sp. 28A]
MGVSIIALGIFLIYWGINYETITFINLGFAGIFIGILILAFIPSNLISYETYECTINPYLSFFENFINNLHLEGKAIYIPPYENLPKGGTFIPTNEDFEINLGNFDDEIVFLTNVGRGKEMGLLISPPLGYNLVKKFEEYADIELNNADLSLAVSIASSVLNTLELVDGVDFKEEGDKIVLLIENVKLKYCHDVDCKVCEKVGCPICSSILFAITKSQNQLILIDKFEKTENFIKIITKKLGKIDDFL